MYLFFGKNQVRARAELRRCTQQAESELSLPCFQNFFFVSSVFHALAAAHELSSFAKWPRMLEHQPQWLPQALEISSEALCARSLLLAELSSFANYHVISVRTKPAARRALLFCKLPRIIQPFVAEPQKQSMNSLPSLAAVAGQPLPSAPVARQSAPIAGQP